MSWEVDFPCGRVQAAIPLILTVVAKKYTLRRSWIELMLHHWSQTWVACGTKYTKIVLLGWRWVESFMRTFVVKDRWWQQIDQEISYKECFDPVDQRCVTVKHHWQAKLSEMSMFSFCCTVLFRSIRTGQAMTYTASREVLLQFLTCELATPIALKLFDGGV